MKINPRYNQNTVHLLIDAIPFFGAWKMVKFLEKKGA
jgi:hypothetical protein